MSIYTYDPEKFMPIFDEDHKLVNKQEFINYKLERSAHIIVYNVSHAVVEIYKAFGRARRTFIAERELVANR